MTPDLKAKELVEKFYSKIEGNTEDAKICASICVEEILRITAPEIDRHEQYYTELPDEHKQAYWQQVKTSIESL